MKKKISAKTVIIIILIGIICLLILSNLNQRNTNIQQQENNKKQLGETTDNVYVEIETHLSEVNTQEQKLISFKSTIANAITEKGVETAEDADATTMANNIKGISSFNSNEVKVTYQYTGNNGTTTYTTTRSDLDENKTYYAVMRTLCPPTSLPSVSSISEGGKYELFHESPYGYTGSSSSVMRVYKIINATSITFKTVLTAKNQGVDTYWFEI